VLYLFHKSACGPCQVVDEFIEKTGDTRVDRIVKVNLEEGVATEEEIQIGAKYGIIATPVLTVTNHDDVVVEAGLWIEDETTTVLGLLALALDDFLRFLLQVIVTEVEHLALLLGGEAGLVRA